jgi:hypothetical protein
MGRLEFDQEISNSVSLKLKNPRSISLLEHSLKHYWIIQRWLEHTRALKMIKHFWQQFTSLFGRSSEYFDTVFDDGKINQSQKIHLN